MEYPVLLVKQHFAVRLEIANEQDPESHTIQLDRQYKLYGESSLFELGESRGPVSLKEVTVVSDKRQ